MDHFVRADTVMKIVYYCGYDNTHFPIDFFSKIKNLSPELLEQVFDYLDTLDILSKNIMKYSEYEIYEDRELYDAWRIRLCKSLDIPPGDNITSDIDKIQQKEDLEFEEARANPDAQLWAKLFIKYNPNANVDEATMIGWFANSMMAIYDLVSNKYHEKEIELRRKYGE